MDVLIVIHTLYGHITRLAEAAAEGVRAAGANPIIKRVPETLPPEVLEKMGATASVAALEAIPVATPEDLVSAGGVIFGTPTRFGNMSAQMRAFLDSTGGLWMAGSLVGKPGSVFVSTATQHGGQETTITSFHTTLLHHGMIIVGLPYAFQGQMTLDEVSGGSPYGATTISGSDGSRMPSENELAGARFQGRHVAEIAMKLA